MTFPAGLACGANVFVCDNLSFSGEIKLARKHTRHIQRDLPRLIASAIGKLGSMQAAQDRRFTAYDAHVIDVAHCPAGSTPDQVSDGLIMQAYRAGVIASSNIGQVLQEWDRPEQPAFRDLPRNLWRLFNAFTSVLTPRIATADLVRRTIALHGILDLYAGLTAAGCLVGTWLSMSYVQLYALASPHSKDHRNDLEKWDREIIEKMPGCPYLHYTRESGTHIVMMPPADSDYYPKAGETRSICLAWPSGSKSCVAACRWRNTSSTRVIRSTVW